MTRHQRRAAETRRWVREAHEGRPCMDCWGVFPWACMDFDHRPGTEKKFDVSQMGGRSRATVQAEIEKCDLVCANCHRIRTHHTRRQRGGQ